MTHDASLPPDVRQWVARHLPDVDTVTDASWPRGDSRIWRVTTGEAAAFVKLYPGPEKYAREVRGCQHAARALAADEAPRLLASEPGLPAVITSALPGRVVRGLSLEAVEERRVHQLAGQLLRRWHDHPEPVPAPVHAGIMASVTAQADEAAACLEHLGEQLPAAQQDLVREVSLDLPRIAEGLRVVYRHGDYSPRNWLWDPASSRHGLIDFEESGPGIAVEDLVWLCGAAWPTRPDLREAFLTGYGSRLPEAEQRALILFTARLAVSYLNTGLTKNESVLIERGRTVLGHMVRARAGW
ncbi:aminoglycoside phosphotransferase family protein [Streptomyces sp. NPDC001404]|uniref:aminoglycoside phosphotransferase family protein n=1 Tax=Streptomyces sp. NPDC001404 TaxID=3364571 RepID=UPI0036798EE0